jgi:hypothetical protein
MYLMLPTGNSDGSSSRYVHVVVFFVGSDKENEGDAIEWRRGRRPGVLEANDESVLVTADVEDDLVVEAGGDCSCSHGGSRRFSVGRCRPPDRVMRALRARIDFHAEPMRAFQPFGAGLLLAALALHPALAIAQPNPLLNPRPAHDHVVFFPRPEPSYGSLSESWFLFDETGRVICMLPCSATLSTSLGYVVDGSGVGRKAYGPGGASEYWSQRYAVPTLSAKVAEGSWAVAQPGRGSPTGAVILVSASGLLVLGGLGLGITSLAIGVRSGGGEGGSGSSGASLGVLLAIPMVGVGLILAIPALALGAYSERPKLEFVTAPFPESAPARPQTLRVSLSPFGIAGSF